MHRPRCARTRLVHPTLPRGLIRRSRTADDTPRRNEGAKSMPNEPCSPAAGSTSCPIGGDDVRLPLAGARGASRDRFTPLSGRAWVTKPHGCRGSRKVAAPRLEALRENAKVSSRKRQKSAAGARGGGRDLWEERGPRPALRRCRGNSRAAGGHHGGDSTARDGSHRAVLLGRVPGSAYSPRN